MKNIIKKELSDVIYNKKSRYMAIIIIFIIAVDAIILFVVTYYPMIRGTSIIEIKRNFFDILKRGYIPTMASYLSGAGTGNVLQILLIWILPIYMLLLYGDKFIQEYRYRYSSLICVRFNKQKIYISKLLAGFISGFGVVFVGLVVNYALCNILFFFGKWDMGMGEYKDDKIMLKWIFNYPNLVYVGYIVAFSIVTGLCVVMCVGLSYAFRNYKILYGVTIGGWLVYVDSKYSISYVIQPYTEYGFERIIASIGILSSAVLISVIGGYIFGVKRGEI